MFKTIAGTNRACQAATKRVQANRDYALRDLEDQVNFNKQRFAGIESVINLYQS